MTFLVTADGNDLDLRTPQPAHITIFDIAWSLSQENRFLRCNRPYSVAEHSLLVREIMERELGIDIHGQMAGLMHDAHEAYTRDMFGPAKAEIDALAPPHRPWTSWEQGWMYVVRRAFGLVTSSAVHHAAIHRADMLALATERRDLMPRSDRPWPCLEGIEPIGWVDLCSPERRKMDWEDWRDRFLYAYHELDFARNTRLFPRAEEGQEER